ncbi:MAG: hypothetical protein ACJAXJ_003763 [Colwellia sp.]|jgi:hypothetical protein
MSLNTVTTEQLSKQMHQQQVCLNGWDMVLSVADAVVSELVSHHWKNACDQCPSSIKIGAAKLVKLNNALKLHIPIHDGSLDSPPAHVLESHVDSRVMIKNDCNGDWSFGLQIDNAVSDQKNDCDLVSNARQWLTGNVSHLPLMEIKAEKNILLKGVDVGSAQAHFVGESNGCDMQVLLAAKGSPTPESTAIKIDQPIPAASGANFSLMVSSGFFIKDVIVAGFNHGPGDVKLESIAPGDAEKEAWYAQVRNPMTYTGSITWGDLMPQVNNNAVLGLTFKGSESQGLLLDHFTAPGSNIALQLSVADNYQAEILGSPGHQMIKIQSGVGQVSATGLVENVIKDQLNLFINKDIKTDMGDIDFSPVTSLLQQQISMANKQLVMSQAQVPADFLITGSIEDK